MTFDFYAAVSNSDISFAHFFIGSPKRVLLQCLLLLFFHGVFIYNTRCLMSQMEPEKKNQTNLDLNPGQLLQLVPDWVGCCVA